MEAESYLEGNEAMTALNSYSLTRDLHGTIPELIDVESSERVLETKGLFIIPYNPSRLVAFVRAEVDVISTANETQTLWSNPELSFYGYCHVRTYKQSVGNPVQLNQRNQILFQWFPLESLVLVNVAKFTVLFSALISAGSDFPVKTYLPSPLITDLSFGFSRAGKFKVTVKIGYFKPDAFPDELLSDPVQEVPNPGDVEGVDPSQYKDLGDPNTPVSAPYRPGDEDFGESVPGTPPPAELPNAVPFRIRFNASGPGFSDVGALSFQYSGPQPTGINLTPILVDGRYVIRVTNANGNVDLFVRGEFVTPAQNEAFLSTFEFVEYVYGG